MTNYKFLMKWDLGAKALLVVIGTWALIFLIGDDLQVGFLTGVTLCMFLFEKLFIPEYDSFRTKEKLEEFNKGVEYGKRF